MILNVKSGELNYVNAGHDEPYFMNEKESYARIKAVGNIVVGAFADLVYTDETIKNVRIAINNFTKDC